MLGVVVVLAGWTSSFISGAELVACPSETVSMDLTTTADIQSLTDAMNCSGEGFFNATLYNTVQIQQRIEVSNQKSVTITGSGFPTLRAATLDTDESSAVADVGNFTGIFLVSGGSTLTMNALVLEGGRSKDGGAVVVLSSSSVHAFDCTFENNNATTGGDTLLGRLTLLLLKLPKPVNVNAITSHFLTSRLDSPRAE